jgi:tRNA-binding protein
MPNAFESLEMRVGRVLRAEPHVAASKPCYKLWIGFGPYGTKTSAAQITSLYAPEELQGRLMVCVLNLPPRSIAGFRSEVLVLGAKDTQGSVVLLAPERDVAPGERVF